MILNLPRPNAAISEGATAPMAREWLQWIRDFVFVVGPRIIDCFFNGIPATGETIFRVPVVQGFTLPTDCLGSLCVSRVAATAQTTFNLLDSGVAFGTAVFAAGAVTATFSSTAHDFAVGDTLDIVCVAADVTLEDVSISLKGSR